QRWLTSAASEAANQFRQSMQVDRLAEVERRREDARGSTGETIAREPCCDESIVVRPYGSVVIRLRVVALFAGGDRADAPARKERLGHEQIAHAFRAIAVDHSREEGVPGIGRAHAAGTAVAVKRQGVGVEVFTPEREFEVLTQLF